MGVKDEAVVLFGPDSDQIAALGMKKKSERSRPKRSAKAVDKG
jgi:acetyl/propionyl-CoA carboxylase alpha subunit